MTAADDVTSVTAIGGNAHHGTAFTTTHWSVVLTGPRRIAGSTGSARETLPHVLVATLWFCETTGLQSRRSAGSNSGFFCAVAREKRSGRSPPRKRAFRSYLLTSLKNFLAKARRRELAVKRGEGRALVSLDELLARERADLEPADTLSAERIYERRWALTLLEQVLARLGEEYRVAGPAAAGLFQRLKQMLTEEPDRPSQAEIAQELSMNENAVKQALYRLRQRYRLLLREEIAHTVAVPGDVEDELRHFIAVLQT